LGPLVTTATKRPILPVLCYYDDGEIGGMIGRGKPKYSEKNLPKCRFVHHKSQMMPGREPRPPRREASD
jgi:hypothetical protein